MPVRDVRGRVIVHWRCRPGRSHHISVRNSAGRLTATLSDGLKHALFDNDLEPPAQAEVMLVAAEGALLLARTGDRTPDATTIMKHMLRLITPSSSRPVAVTRR